MRLNALSYCALFLATACPILCRGSMAFAGACSHGPICASQAGTTDADNCPDDQPIPSVPSDPCEDVSCFCSPFVMIEQADGATAALTMSELPMNACTSMAILPPCDAMDRGLLERTALPDLTAKATAALPLLI